MPILKPAVATLRMAPLVLPQLASGGVHPRRGRPGARGACERRRARGAAESRKRWSEGNLSRFDAIVVGPRAYETDSALVANNRRLLDYARRGGLVIVQYQQHRFFNGRFAPYPLTLGATGG